MDNLYLWLGVGLSLVIIAVIYFLVRTTKTRAREVEELNQHFPETNESVTVENMRGKLRRSQRTGAEITVDEKDKGVAEKRIEERASDGVEKDVKEPDKEGFEEGSEKPVRYRRSIFHTEHLKKDQDKSGTE